MMKAMAVLSLLGGVTAQAAGPGFTDFPGYHTEVRVYSSSVPSLETWLWSATYRGNEVEFDIAPRSAAKSFCVTEPFLNMNQARGFVIRSQNGDDKDEHWTFMPKGAKSGENQWCFAVQHSYRFDVWLVRANGDVALQYPVEFEIEQQWRYVTDLGRGSQDFKQRGRLCAEKFCGDIIRAK